MRVEGDRSRVEMCAAEPAEGLDSRISFIFIWFVACEQKVRDLLKPPPKSKYMKVHIYIPLQDLAATATS